MECYFKIESATFDRNGETMSARGDREAIENCEQNDLPKRCSCGHHHIEPSEEHLKELLKWVSNRPLCDCIASVKWAGEQFPHSCPAEDCPAFDNCQLFLDSLRVLYDSINAELKKCKKETRCAECNVILTEENMWSEMTCRVCAEKLGFPPIERKKGV
jgi:hypothetical protein